MDRNVPRTILAAGALALCVAIVGRACIINVTGEYPTINAELIISLNEEGGEENVTTGWHAIEFLLWGQDLNDDGLGDRPVTDYATADNADRGGQYLGGRLRHADRPPPRAFRLSALQLRGT